MADILTREQLTDKIDAVDRLLSSERQWTQGVGARDADDKPVRPDSPVAVCWCMQGAAWKIAGNQTHYRQIVVAFKEAINQPQITIGEYNDSTTFSSMKTTIQRAKTLAAVQEPFDPLPDANGGVVAGVVLTVIGIAGMLFFHAFPML